ncbi:metallophosphoesterase [Enterococcus gilvus]|uniref:metallophosphoesterase n=1 Tax=Enterococcus gilvus TaxID=160453 RepID=UPI001C8B37B2|nr:metallophosphoesterase [Enterococcus gilvus]MBX8938491.1 hypothetical protein [Enterococcus gilvus]
MGEPELFYQNKLNELKNSLNQNVFTVGFVTDSHFDFGTWRKNAFLSLRNLNNIQSLSQHLDVLICGGDNVDSEQLSHKQKLDNLINYLSFFFIKSETDKFAIRGNHDQGGLINFNGEGKVLPDKVISDEEFKVHMKAKQTEFEEVRNDDSLYGYKDYPEDKIRVIFVDSLDNPEILKNDGSLKYFAQWDYGYREKQLLWIAEEALYKCPEDYHIIMFSHIPLRNRTSDELRNKRNFNLLINVINSFVEKKVVSIESDIEDFEVAKHTIDFSKRSESNFVGFVAGHDHKESIIDNGSFNTVVCDNALPDEEAFVNSYKEDAFTILQIDTKKRIFDLKGFGRASNRTIQY